MGYIFTNIIPICRWFHGSITRDEAEYLLQPREDGLFLVRESTNFPGDYTLCVCFQGKVEHYRVKYLDKKLTIDDEEYFDNLGQLVIVSFRQHKTTVLCNFNH
jgi:c-src tyrosine kinase